ncbi:hypothetical protein CRV08_09725 [Halarcobacter ebronensis]|uniref:Uncharacterized protein n=1 Tax=Halarcobacter ebronensis TaxID=1462615 RepID=A0A4Q0YF25_9BACT|nr:hypothetical protein [Halarcobacter ebronensis]RXJ67639.1 hypothetical protein CRV08_09725 [Halarcobacter ebronensis]
MKKILLILLLSLSINAQQHYTYLIDEYDKVIELEAKIISKIAKDILKDKEINLFIPDIKDIDKKVYSKKVHIVDSCDKANFIFVKYTSNLGNCYKINEKHLFTNNYKRLLHNHQYVGAFFWSKSRPNIIFVKDRLSKNNIILSDEYKQFVEDYNED